jgi:hypothetical protein
VITCSFVSGNLLSPYSTQKIEARIPSGKIVLTGTYQIAKLQMSCLPVFFARKYPQLPAFPNTVMAFEGCLVIVPK